MAFTLRQIRYFIAVAENGSVSGASQSLGISQSTVTEAVKALESQLGAVLVERHARGLSLTHKGHQFLRHAYSILGSVAEAARALEAEAQPATGELNLGVTSLVAGYFLADLLAGYRRAFPQVKVQVTEDSRDYIEHLLVNGELDIAVLIVSNLANQAALLSELLVASPYRLWLPARHPLLERDAISLGDVAEEELILLAVDELEEMTGHYWRSAGLRPSVALRTSSVEAVRSLVATGAGLAILPDMAFRPWSLEGDRLEARPLSDSLPTVGVGLAWRRGAPQPDNAARFLAVAREHRRGR